MRKINNLIINRKDRYVNQYKNLKYKHMITNILKYRSLICSVLTDLLYPRKIPKLNDEIETELNN